MSSLLSFCYPSCFSLDSIWFLPLCLLCQPSSLSISVTGRSQANLSGTGISRQNSFIRPSTPPTSMSLFSTLFSKDLSRFIPSLQLEDSEQPHIQSGVSRLKLCPFHQDKLYLVKSLGGVNPRVTNSRDSTSLCGKLKRQDHPGSGLLATASSSSFPEAPENIHQQNRDKSGNNVCWLKSLLNSNVEKGKFPMTRIPTWPWLACSILTLCKEFHPAA